MLVYLNYLSPYIFHINLGDLVAMATLFAGLTLSCVAFRIRQKD